MIRSYFQNLEYLDSKASLELDTLIDELAFNEDGLIPVITQDATSKTVLMLAWMNKESLHKTIETKLVTYWSRSTSQPGRCSLPYRS